MMSRTYRLPWRSSFPRSGSCCVSNNPRGFLYLSAGIAVIGKICRHVRFPHSKKRDRKNAKVCGHMDNRKYLSVSQKPGVHMLLLRPLAHAPRPISWEAWARQGQSEAAASQRHHPLRHRSDAASPAAGCRLCSWTAARLQSTACGLS